MKKIFFLTALTLCYQLVGYQFSHSSKKISSTKQEVTVTFKLKASEYLYKDSLIPSVDRAEVTLSPFITNTKVVSFFDESYKKQKEGYTGIIQFKTTVTLKQDMSPSQAHLHLHFMVSTDQKPQERSILLTFDDALQPLSVPDQTALPQTESPSTAPLECEPQQPSLVGNLVTKVLNYIGMLVSYTRDSLASIFKNTGSKAVRALVALLLGILLSLTPCIYPMIPITIGILQAQGSSSASRNFLLALSYTLGISLTFAILGFIAALGSCVFGELQGNPFLLIPLSLMLFYFGLTMFDVVQLPIPRWLIPKGPQTKGGSPWAAFLFGALSGTIASPCLSPGLILLLNYVGTITTGSIGAYLEGFMLLFIFGVGSSLPLLIIGTFSGSLTMLPKAGAWMNEVKKIVGILLISMGLYHLSHVESLIPWYIFVWLVVLTFIGLAIYYFVSIKSTDTRGIRHYKNGMALFLILVAAAIGVQGTKAVIEHIYPEAPTQRWSTSYQAAKEQAIKQKTLMFIDIGATYCASCKALDARIFKAECIQDTLALFSLLKIEADTQVEVYEEVKALFGKDILGYPTYLIVDPMTEQVIKKWSVELDELTLDGIEAAFKKIATEHNTRINLPKVQ